MLIDTQKISSWYVLHKGFRLTENCRHCESPLSHYKAFEKNYSGIVSRCDSCGKEIVRMRSTVHDKAPLDRHSAVNDEVFGRVREGSGIVEGFDGGVVKLLHS